MIMDISKCKVWVRSDLYLTRMNVYNESYYTVVETPKGSRFAHNMIFYKSKLKDVTIEAERIANNVKDKGEIDLDLWSEIDPVYGSERWLELNGT